MHGKCAHQFPHTLSAHNTINYFTQRAPATQKGVKVIEKRFLTLLAFFPCDKRPREFYWLCRYFQTTALYSSPQYLLLFAFYFFVRRRLSLALSFPLPPDFVRCTRLRSMSYLHFLSNNNSRKATSVLDTFPGCRIQLRCDVLEKFRFMTWLDGVSVLSLKSYEIPLISETFSSFYKLCGFPLKHFWIVCLARSPNIEYW